MSGTVAAHHDRYESDTEELLNCSIMELLAFVTLFFVFFKKNKEHLHMIESAYHVVDVLAATSAWSTSQVDLVPT